MAEFVKRRLQVFVSSTYTDLIEERQAAVSAILETGHIPAGMELFTAGDESQMAVIKQWIDESDVYLLILGGRYGSVEPSTGKSYTHLEFEYAQEIGKPLFAVVADQDALEERVAGGGGSKLLEMKHPQKLTEFRQLVTADRIVEFWKEPRDIEKSVLKALMAFERRGELRGWIRPANADQAMAFAKIDRLSSTGLSLIPGLSERQDLRAEIARLKAENKELRKRQTKSPREALADIVLELLESPETKDRNLGLPLAAQLGRETPEFKEVISTAIANADLRKADLRRADLRELDLSGVDLRKANLVGADLSDANLACANFEGARLGMAEFRKADLSDANLARANLRMARLSNANLKRARLSFAKLANASLCFAQLDGAILDGANLRVGDFWGAKLNGAKLNGADLGRARRLTQEQLDYAEGNHLTKIPDYLTRPFQWDTEDTSE